MKKDLKLLLTFYNFKYRENRGDQIRGGRPNPRGTKSAGTPVLCKSFEFLTSDLLLSDSAFKGQNTGLFLVADELVVVGIFASFIFTAIRFEWFLRPRDVCCVRWLVTRVLMVIFWISSFLLNFFPPLDLLYFLLSY